MSSGKYISEQPDSQVEKKTEAQIFEEQNLTEHISESMRGSSKMYADAEDDATPSIERRQDSSTETLGEARTERVKFETDPELEAQVAAEREKYEKEQAKKDAAREEENFEATIRPKARPKAGAPNIAKILEEEPVDDKVDIKDNKQLHSNIYFAQTLGGIGTMAWIALLTPLTDTGLMYTICKVAFYLLNIAAIAVLCFSIVNTRDKTIPATLTWPFTMATLAPGFFLRFFLYEHTANPGFGNPILNIAPGIIFWAIAAGIHYFVFDHFHIKPPTHLAVTYFMMMILYFFLDMATTVIGSHDITKVSVPYEYVIKLICILIFDLAASQSIPTICSKLRSKSQW